MDGRRVAGHIIIWGLAGFGAYLSFSLFPAGFVLLRNNIMSLLIIPAILYWVYSSLGLSQLRRRVAFGTFKIGDVIQKRDYGMMMHPICVADVILAWGIFFFYPDLRVLISVIWITIVVSFWLKIERHAMIQATGNNWKEDEDINP